jgi:methylenetetrahydrofolate reductase (NADPH)
MEATLTDSINRLSPLSPDFVSVTYGAGGSTKDTTRQTLQTVLATGNTPAAAHITCVGATRDEVDAVVRDFASLGIRRFVALRGDPAGGVGTRYQPHPDGYQNAAHLVAGLKAFGDFDISVAAYPERHPESPDLATDLDMLKRKVDNGATRAITQFFFDNDTYERYVERVRRAGIYIPIVPGIVPIHNFGAVRNFASKCGTSIPAWLRTVSTGWSAIRTPTAGRRRRRCRTGFRSRRPRRQRLPFLHDEPPGSCLRDLPPDRHPRDAGGRPSASCTRPESAAEPPKTRARAAA